MKRKKEKIKEVFHLLSFCMSTKCQPLDLNHWLAFDLVAPLLSQRPTQLARQPSDFCPLGFEGHNKHWDPIFSPICDWFSSLSLERCTNQERKLMPWYLLVEEKRSSFHSCILSEEKKISGSFFAKSIFHQTVCEKKNREKSKVFSYGHSSLSMSIIVTTIGWPS